MPEPIKVFVSYCWQPEDEEVTGKIVAIFKRSRSFEVVDVKNPVPSRVFDRVTTDAIDSSYVTIGIFTRYSQRVDNGKEIWLPPPYVIAETSYAMGSYKPYGTMKRVLGFHELGVDPTKHVGMLSLTGETIPSFERGTAFEQYRTDIEGFIKVIPDKLRKGGERSYVQKSLEKRVTIESGGRVWTENRVTVQVIDPDRFTGIDHMVSVPKNSGASLPSLKTMMETPISRRFVKPYFGFALLGYSFSAEASAGIRVEETPPTDELVRRARYFKVTFPITSGRLKKGDQFTYQYVWGLPNLYPLKKSQLRGVEANTAWIVASKGPIDHASLTLRFTRDLEFSKKPHVFVLPQVTRVDLEPFMAPLDSVEGTEQPTDTTYRRFFWEWDNFTSTVVAQWTPG